MSKLLVLYNPDHINHFWQSHVERPERVVSLLEGLSCTLSSLHFGKVYFENEKLKVFFNKDLIVLEDIENFLYLAHEKDYVSYIKTICMEKKLGFLDLDTYFTSYTYKVAVEAVGANIISYYLLKDYKYIFNVVRPPGHHATKNKAMGFCIFNNIATLAKFLLKENIRKIFIIDFDAHHGNGTQEIVYNDRDIYYFSTHFYPGYPGTGLKDENNEHIFNVPVDPDSSDEVFFNIYGNYLESLFESCKPEIILVSAGFDIHELDPITPLKVSYKGIEFILEKIKNLAEKYNLKVIFSLEGGYNLDVLKICGKIFGEIFKS